jgi:hypothetical protein
MKPNFTYLDPDENSYKPNILTAEQWNLEYIKLTDKTGYWTGNHPFCSDKDFEEFRNLIGNYPVCKSNNHEGCNDPNPFATIHLPTWISGPVVNIVKDFYHNNYPGEVKNINLREWGNLFERDKMRPVEIFRIPHVDSPAGLVCNMWFSEHEPNLSGTNLYEYKGKTYGDYYDFMVDDNHPLYKEWSEHSKSLRNPGWRNFTLEEADYWGFDLVGIAPVRNKGVTLYEASVPHAPYINDSIDYRWSHTFAYSFEKVELTLGNLGL